MNPVNDITSEDFEQFLHGLGVETYNLPFGEMLEDPEFSEVLGWMYNNLDHNNALSDWEKSRYAEIEKEGKLLPSDKLETQISSIQKELQGLCLPGDEDAIEDVKLDINMQKEKLTMLEEHEQILKDLLLENEQTKEDLSRDITKLNAAHSLCTEEEATVSEECIQLAENVECITNDVMNIISNKLNVYASCGEDKETAKTFFTFAPLESYRKSQTLFKFNFNLFMFTQFIQKQNNNSLDEDLKMAFFAAKNMEERLFVAVSSYIETKTDLCGIEAKLSLLSNYNPNEIPSCTIEEAQHAIQISNEEEDMITEQLDIAIRNYVEGRMNSIEAAAVKSVLVVHEKMYKDISLLYRITREALSLDEILYKALYRELGALEELTEFASDFRSYRIEDENAVGSRIKSMNEICTVQENIEIKLKSSNPILNALTSIFECEPSTLGLLPIKLYILDMNLKELNEDIYEECVIKEHDLGKIKQSLLYSRIQEYIWDGCTKKPNCYNRSLSAMKYALKNEMEKINAKFMFIQDKLKSAKEGDEHNLRKLWQWFLTDPEKFLEFLNREHQLFV